MGKKTFNRPAIKPGSLVRLKSGGPLMTVTVVSESAEDSEWRKKGIRWTANVLFYNPVSGGVAWLNECPLEALTQEDDLAEKDRSREDAAPGDLQGRTEQLQED